MFNPNNQDDDKAALHYDCTDAAVAVVAGSDYCNLEGGLQAFRAVALCQSLKDEVLYESVIQPKPKVFSRIGLFWDAENAQIPTCVNFTIIADVIYTTIQKEHHLPELHGTIYAFACASGFPTLLPPEKYNEAGFGELCYTYSKIKHSADQRIIKKMQNFASHSMCKQSTIILISRDGGFKKPLVALRAKGMQIITIVSWEKTLLVGQFQAVLCFCLVWCWLLP